MVCLVCLTNDTNSHISIYTSGENRTQTDFSAELCDKCSPLLQQIIREWIRTNRESSVVNASEKAKEDRKHKKDGV